MKILNVVFLCLIIFIVFLLSCSEGKIKYRNKKKILLAFVVIISAFCGLRVIGLDLEPYRGIFDANQIIPLDFDFIKNMLSGKLEPAFVILISLVKQLRLEFRTFLFVSAIIPMYLIYLIIIKKEKKIPLITFLFFILLCLFRGPVDTVRNFFAAVVYLSAIYSLSQNNRAKFCFKSLLAVSLHYSSVAIFLVRPFLRIRWSLLSYILTMTLLSLFAFLGKGFLVDYISNLDLTNPILFKFQYYLVYATDNYVYINSLHEELLFLMAYIPVFFNVFINLAILKHMEIIENDNFYMLLLNSQIIGSILILVCVAFGSSTLGIRLNFLFSIGSFFMVKEAIFNDLIKHKQWVFTLAVMYLCFYNLIIIAYFAGVHVPGTPFSLV